MGLFSWLIDFVMEGGDWKSFRAIRLMRKSEKAVENLAEVSKELSKEQLSEINKIINKVKIKTSIK